MGTIERTLRTAVANSGLSLKAIADGTTTPYACVYDWVHDTRKTLRVTTADKLAKLFELELKPVKRRKVR